MEKALLLLLALSLTACNSELSESASVRSAQTDASFLHLDKAIDLNNQATEIANSTSLVVTADEMSRILELRRAALAEARKVDIGALNAERNGLGDLFQEKFLRGLELYVEGDGRSDLVLGQTRLAQWTITVNAMR